MSPPPRRAAPRHSLRTPSGTRAERARCGFPARGLSHARAGGARPRQPCSFRKIDVNGDGYITLDEFLDFFCSSEHLHHFRAGEPTPCKCPTPEPAPEPSPASV